MFAQHDAAAIEGVGLNDIGSRLEVSCVNTLDHIRAAQNQDLSTVRLTPIIVRRKLVFEYLRAHAAVVYDDTFANCFQEGFHLYQSRPLFRSGFPLSLLL